MGWWQRIKEGVTTQTTEKKETPDGIWYKCPTCKTAILAKDLHDNYFICPEEDCGHHFRIQSKDYFEIIFKKGYETYFDDLESVDILEFTDKKSYPQRLEEAKKRSDLTDAMSVAFGPVRSHELVVACMDFDFIGGSMGSVVGEKISRSIDLAIEKKVPLLIISKSGGARMMEAAFSLMQMAKTSAKLTLLADAGLPYFSLMTDPTTGGVTASFSMLGDVNMAEPGALIGFAGPRVIKETIKKDLPKGFQRSEFLLEAGFLDTIVPRDQLRDKLDTLMTLFKS